MPRPKGSSKGKKIFYRSRLPYFVAQAAANENRKPITQEELARITEIDAATINRWMKTDHLMLFPNMQVAGKLAAYFAVTPFDILEAIEGDSSSFTPATTRNAAKQLG